MSIAQAFLPTSETFPEDEAELRIKLSTLHSSIASAINTREIAFYQNGQQTPTGQQFSSGGTQRQGFRTTYYFGAVNTGATLNIAHGLTGITTFTKILGTAVTASDFRPIPYASATAASAQIEVLVGTTNISIINGSTAPAITSGILVLEYLYT